MKATLTSGGALRLGVALLVIVALAGGGLAFFLHSGQHKANAETHSSENGDGESAATSVKTIHATIDKTRTMEERRPATILAYYRDELESRVAGVIDMIRVAPGKVVKKGETLIDIYVPELEARVKEEEANHKLAQAQVEQRKAAVTVAESELEVVVAKIEALRAKQRSDEAYYTFRKKQATRYQGLLVERAIDAKLVDEQEDRREAAFEQINATKENLKAEIAHQKSAAARIVQAKADLTEAERKVDVSQALLDHARAMREFAIIYAPFDGVIVTRDSHANEGAIVQKADTGHPQPLLIIERQDIVTVVMRLPDSFAPYITPETEAIFETSSLPGIKIHGKVTRYPPSLVNPEHDRTMLVEVDLWNGDEESFNKVKDDKKFRASLKTSMPNDPNGGLPIVPEIKGKLSAGLQKKLMPGMFGQMTLLLRKFDSAYMIPSSAIVTPGGYSYLWMVKDGKAHMHPIHVQVDDGKLAKVELLGKKGEVIGSLTGEEEIIVSNQSELSEGQKVKTSPVENWKSLMPADQKEKH